MYREVNYNEYSKEILNQLIKGAFLTVKNKDMVNTMTIGWGSAGYMWRRPIFTAMVRYSRYTYELIKDAEYFTVSFPLKGQLKKELGYCGTKSGRELDKFKECKLTLRDGEAVACPVIDECDLHLECRIIYNQPLDPKALPEKIDNSAYSDKDYHVLFYGEVVKTYVKD